MLPECMGRFGAKLREVGRRGTIYEVPGFQTEAVKLDGSYGKMF